MTEIKEIQLHGHRLSYRCGGHGPLLILIHGITNSSASWEPILALLERDFTVIAPDLLGHGDSAKPRGDYSLGSFASLLRDFMLALGHDRATIAGHSLGGGIAMQMAYQFPERVERLVLVSSGGLGRQVTPVLRAVALPGAELMLPLLASRAIVNAGAAIGELDREDRAAHGHGHRRDGGRPRLAAGHRDAPRVRAHRALGDRRLRPARRRDRQALPRRRRPDADHVGRRTTRSSPPATASARTSSCPAAACGSSTGSGHFPHHDDPVGFVTTLREFVATTQPSEPDDDRLRRLVVEHGGRAA